MTQMKLNHVNLTVSDVLGTREFLAKYFGLTAMEGAPMNEKLGFMTDANGMVLSLMNLGQRDDVAYPGAFHIGFIQDSREKVDEMNQCMKDDGLHVQEPRELHGSYTYYVRSPGGVLVEVQSMI